MKKVINLILMITITVSAWEINTHRAIDRKAIENSDNLKSFINNSGIKNQNYKNEKFEGYSKSYYAGDYSYIDYVLNGEENGISDNKWNQIFNIYNVNYQDLIESGAILEDAQWSHFLDGGTYNYWDKAHGRFVNHFYDAQNGGHALTYGAFLRTDALHWGLGSRIYAGTYGGQATYGFTSLIDLAPGESIVVAIQRDTSITSKNIIVVYDGIIGDERGLAVCAAQTPEIMAN